MARLNRGEVWSVAFDPSVGSAITKTHRVVIVSNDAANRHQSTCCRRAFDQHRRATLMRYCHLAALSIFHAKWRH